MTKFVNIRSLSFDTSFLLKDNYYIDLAIKKILNSKIPCFITSTVISELEQLKANTHKEEYLKRISELEKEIMYLKKTNKTLKETENLIKNKIERLAVKVENIDF